jgi:hypothetical protein
MNPMSMMAMAAFLPVFPQSIVSRRVRVGTSEMIARFALWAAGFAFALGTALPF